MNGGYKMINKSSNKIYSELVACLTLGKPILWYEDKNTCFFIDTISGGEITTEIVDDEEVTTYGDIILTKGGMTITITAENVVTEEGNIQPGEYHLYRYNIVCQFRDYNDNDRRIFFEITSPLNLDVTALDTDTALANLKLLIGGDEIYIPVSSDVYVLSALTQQDRTLIMALYLLNNEFKIMNIDADHSWSTSMTNFQIIRGMTKKLQLF